MSYQAMQDAIKDLSENEEYRNSIVMDPEKLMGDFNLDSNQLQALSSEIFNNPRVSITPEIGMGCCSLCSCAPPVRRN